MPTASGGSASLEVDRPSTSSMTITTTPMRAPQASKSQRMSPPKTPLTRDEIREAWGAARASRPAPGAPWNPKAVFIKLSTGGMMREPKSTPMTKATCCFQGVAPTSWPVLRSWRLSLEIVAIPKTMAVVNKVKATSVAVSAGSWEPTTDTIRAAVMATKMPTPEIGLLEAPIRPAM